VRDYTFLDDAVRHLVACGTAEAAGLAGQAVNLGSGKGHSVEQVVQAALRASGSTLEPTFDPGRFRANESGAVVQTSLSIGATGKATWIDTATAQRTDVPTKPIPLNLDRYGVALLHVMPQ